MGSERKHLDSFLSTPRPGLCCSGPGSRASVASAYLASIPPYGNRDHSVLSFLPVVLRACGPQWLLGVGTSFPYSALGWVCDSGAATQGIPGGSDGKVSVYNVGDLGSMPGSGRFPGEGNGNPLQYSCLENPMDGDFLSMGLQRVGHN